MVLFTLSTWACSCWCIHSGFRTATAVVGRIGGQLSSYLSVQLSSYPAHARACWCRCCCRLSGQNVISVYVCVSVNCLVVCTCWCRNTCFEQAEQSYNQRSTVFLLSCLKQFRVCCGVFCCACKRVGASSSSCLYMAARPLCIVRSQSVLFAGGWDGGVSTKAHRCCCPGVCLCQSLHSSSGNAQQQIKGTACNTCTVHSPLYCCVC